MHVEKRHPQRLLGAVRRVCYRRSYQRPRSFLARPPGFIVEVVHEALCKSALFLFEALLLLSFVIAAALQLRKSEKHRPAVVFHQLRTGTSVVGNAILVDDYLVVLPKEPGVHGVGFRYTPLPQSMQNSLVSSVACETASADAVLLNPADRKVPWACSYDMPRFSRASFGFEARAADGRGR